MKIISLEMKCAKWRIGCGALLCSAFSYASIAPGIAVSGAQSAYSGNGELFMSVFDATAKVSYTLDLGVTINDFYGDAQQDAGYQRFWTVNDAQWDSFLTQVDQANLRWAVLGFDFTGGVATGQQRLFSTIKQGDEAKVRTTTNQKMFSLGSAAATAGTFFSAVNISGTHGASGVAPDYSVNGSSVNADTDPGNGYFGSNAGLTPTFNGNTTWNNSNAVGQSSWFYYITRSGANQLDTILVDEFDNIAPGSAGDGYFGFTYVDASLHPESPYGGKYLLSYTLQPAISPAQAAFAASIGRTEYSGAYAVRALPGTAGASSVDNVAGLSRALSVPNVSAVPEPANGALWLAGLGALTLVARRRRR